MICALLCRYVRRKHGDSDGRESACNAGDQGLIPGSGRSPGEGIGNPLQYSCLENLKDRAAWRATVHESHTQMSDSFSLFFFFFLHMYFIIQYKVSQVALVVKNPPASAGDLRGFGSLVWEDLGGGGHGNPLQYFCLKNPMDRGAWRDTVHWVAKSLTPLK